MTREEKLEAIRAKLQTESVMYLYAYHRVFSKRGMEKVKTAIIDLMLAEVGVDDLYEDLCEEEDKEDQDLGTPEI